MNNMRGYSKLNTTNSFIDPIKLFQPPPISRELTEDIHPFEHDDDIVKGGEVFGVILSRKSPPAAGHSHSHRFDHPDHDHDHSSSSFVRRVFSMRRSCSVSERYCRIHDNFLPHSVDGMAPPVSKESSAAPWTGSGPASKKKANSKLLKACKRMFRL